jgi:phenylalanine-4-hydroxylase
VGQVPGELRKDLDILAKHQLNMSNIESEPTTTLGEYIIYVDVALDSEESLKSAEEALKELKANNVKQVELLHTKGKEVIWFPRRMADLDSFATKVMAYGTDLDADHPGFRDEVYRARRSEITMLARKFKTGDHLPHIEYTKDEIATWGVVYNKLKEQYPKYACKQHRYVFPLLEANCGYGPDSIPQLEVVSQFLMSATGWRLRPVMGLLSSRDFLNGLAFRVFHSTQYIRHSSKPLYTPEPDVCHELLGHVPLFADPAFSEFSQAIGIASLGASDEEITRLASVYWFTVEFGICREDGEIKAYGAGILSSFGELEYACNSDKPKILPFDPWVAAVTEFPITSYQPTYFCANSFEEATSLVRRYADSLSREHAIIYDPYTMTMQVLDSKNSIRRLSNQLATQSELLSRAINLL